jgi:hypothetical protein
MVDQVAAVQVLAFSLVVQLLRQVKVMLVALVVQLQAVQAVVVQVLLVQQVQHLTKAGQVERVLLHQLLAAL